MLVEHRGHIPVVSNSAFVASTAVVSGAVTLGDGVRVLHGAVLSAEDGEIHIEQNSIIMEHALVRGRAGHDVRIGHSVMVGPHAHINGAVIEEGAFIATGASLFPGSVIGAGAEVRINGVVQVNTEVAAGTVVPIGRVAVGSPAQLFSPDRHDDDLGNSTDAEFCRNGVRHRAGDHDAGAHASAVRLLRSPSRRSRDRVAET